MFLENAARVKTDSGKQLLMGNWGFGSLASRKYRGRLRAARNQHITIKIKM